MQLAKWQLRHKNQEETNLMGERGERSTVRVYFVGVTPQTFGNQFWH